MGHTPPLLIALLSGIHATISRVSSHSNLNRELTLHKLMNAGEGIRTRELLREQILSLPPLTAWLPPHNYRKRQRIFPPQYHLNVSIVQTGCCPHLYYTIPQARS